MRGMGGPENNNNNNIETSWRLLSDWILTVRVLGFIFASARKKSLFEGLNNVSRQTGQTWPPMEAINAWDDLDCCTAMARSHGP